MRILLVNNAEKGVNDFIGPIKALLIVEGVESTAIEYAELPFHDPFDYDGVILSASPKGDNIVDSHTSLYSWIKSYDKPVLGICAGHQIIGNLYGSKLIRDEQSEVGDTSVFISRSDPIFNDIASPFKARHTHNDAITLPEDFISLAHSERCPNQVMKHIDKPIYTAQFHAEISNPRLIKNYLDIVTANTKTKETRITQLCSIITQAFF